jgi:hypothetical protein
MTGENTTSRHTSTRSSFEALLAFRLGSITNLYLFSVSDPQRFKEAEQSARKLIISDEDLLIRETQEELKKAKELFKKKFPIRYWINGRRRHNHKDR